MDILKNHIFNVVGRYKGKITEWDVCNEVLDDDQSIVRSDPTAYKLRPSIWATYIGEEFIDSAFVWAHQADPDAKLYINEYGAEMVGKTKTEAYYNLVKRVMIASSAYRMGLYVSEYGLTATRLCVFWALGVIALFMLGVILSICKPAFSLFRYGIIVIGLFQ